MDNYTQKWTAGVPKMHAKDWQIENEGGGEGGLVMVCVCVRHSRVAQGFHAGAPRAACRQRLLQAPP